MSDFSTLRRDWFKDSPNTEVAMAIREDILAVKRDLYEESLVQCEN